MPTDDWPPGAYLVKLDADSGAQRYVPVTVRSPSCAGKVVLKSCVQTWQAYNTWGGYDLYKGPSGAYSERSLVVSLDRPYDTNGANMFLTYERNVVKLAEFLTTQKGGLDLAYVTSMDIDADPRLLDGASALISMGHDEYWTPQERANVTAARDKGVNLAFFGANAMFRRTRLQPTALGAAREVVCYKTAYRQDPEYAKDPTEVTSDWREPPNSDPESTLIGTIYEGYPVDAPFVVSSPRSWVYQGTGVSEGDSFPHLVGVEYDRVNPAYPLQRPIEVLSHSPLTCGGRRQLRRLRLLHPYGRRGRLQQRHDALGRGDLRRPAARHRRRHPGVRPPGHDQRAARLRRRPRRGQVQGQRQPGRHPRARRQPDRPGQPPVARGQRSRSSLRTGAAYSSR